eukprot:1852494-Pleurochrysis_carterae.AAC.7
MMLLAALSDEDDNGSTSCNNPNAGLVKTSLEVPQDLFFCSLAIIQAVGDAMANVSCRYYSWLQTLRSRNKCKPLKHCGRQSKEGTPFYVIRQLLSQLAVVFLIELQIASSAVSKYISGKQQDLANHGTAMFGKPRTLMEESGMVDTIPPAARAHLRLLEA